VGSSSFIPSFQPFHFISLFVFVTRNLSWNKLCFCHTFEPKILCRQSGTLPCINELIT